MDTIPKVPAATSYLPLGRLPLVKPQLSAASCTWIPSVDINRLTRHSGIFACSWAQDRWGYRRTIQAALIALTGFIFIVFFAPNIEVLFVGQVSLCIFIIK